MESGMNHESFPEDHTTQMAEDLILKVNLIDEEKETQVDESIQDEEEASDDDTEEEEEEFSFSIVYDGANTSPISADDAFANGQIKPVFPLFNQDLLLKEGVVMEDLIAKDRLPNVKKVFIEASTPPATASTSTSGSGDVTGSYYYEWENKAAAEGAPDGCKKSNSTGFSKIWRFRDLMHRSSSDGRDAFVFLNNNNNTASSGTNMNSKNKSESTTAAVIKTDKEKKKKKTVAEAIVNGGEIKVNPAGEKSKASNKAKKLVKSKTTVASAHEVYLRSKAKEQERRKSYLPYRPGVVGFFTNITGGALTKNVHPY